ncbi:recombinase family protein [Enterococcus faecalis]|nr:recombinase family protein [Enterococcus faecalis]
MQTLEAGNCERIYTDKLSGRNNNRPEFNKLLNKLQPQDILVITKLDRRGPERLRGICIDKK